ncbi:hypothetical protein M404DRAFT_246831 [Pisolithus tinctorius Marx 270]|uniref:Uncharacterized protein n=1 Tax=Pisolithus tinctorius Marx 270 TaxID=870435 RepID=A0A0C3JFC4_PISTI|nr:hypothetical protein M404DRAFT_246831 [Pisolithus tinctorius Marx 270]
MRASPRPEVRKQSDAIGGCCQSARGYVLDNAIDSGITPTTYETVPMTADMMARLCRLLVDMMSRV